MSWNNLEDFEKDLYEFSENQVSPNDEPQPLPVTIAQWNALQGSNQEQSIYDTIEYDHSVTIVCSGRGRGRPSELYRPGAPVNHSNINEDDIKRRLQEVNSQAYVNANIEAAFKIKNGHPKHDEFCDVFESNGFTPVDITSSSSSSPVLIEQIEEIPVLLPLSQIMQKERLKSKQRLYSQVLKQKNDSEFKK